MRSHLIETFRVAAAPTERAASSVRERAQALGLAIRELETETIHFAFLARAGWASGLLYGTHTELRSARDYTTGDYTVRPQEEDRFTKLELSGYQAVALAPDAPVSWAALLPETVFEAVGAEPCQRLDAEQLDAGVKAGVERELAEDARARGWSVVRTKVEVQGTGPCFQVLLPYVRTRFRVAPPELGRVIEGYDPDTWATTWHACDGRLLKDGMPTPKAHPAFWWILGVGAALLLLAALVGLVAAVVVLW